MFRIRIVLRNTFTQILISDKEIEQMFKIYIYKGSVNDNEDRQNQSSRARNLMIDTFFISFF